MRKMAFIYNPTAGKGTIKAEIGSLVQIFSDKDYLVTCIPTKRKNYCRDYIIEEGKNYDTVVIAGGDGTVNEVFNALNFIEESERPDIGYIPMGTTNDFAASCHIPGNLAAAARIAAGDKTRKIDAGRFNDSYFAYVAAFGAFTSVSYDTKQQAKSMFGYAAYVFEGIKSISSIKPHKMKVKYGQNEIEDEFIFGMVANSNSVGGLKLDKLHVDLSDGLFEVLLLKNIKPGEINAVLSDLKNSRIDSKYYYVFKTDKLNVTSHASIAWTLDGEFGGSVTEAEIENIPGLVKIKIEE